MGHISAPERVMRGRRLKRDVAVNAIFAVLKIAVLLWVIRIAGAVFLPATLGLFLLARRISATGANLLQLGMSQTLRRRISMSIEDVAVKRAYVVVALLIWLGFALGTVFVLFSIEKPLAAWLFPSAPGSDSLASLTGLLLLSTVLYFIAGSILLAERRMVRANVVELLSVSGFLILVLLWKGDDATPVGVLQFQAVAMVALSLAVVGAYLIELRRAPWLGGGVWTGACKEFFSYGVPRGAIAFLDMMVLLIGPWLLRAEAEEAGFLIVALILVQGAQAALMPIAQVASVVAARFVGRRDDDSIGEGVRLLFGTVLYATLLGTAVVIPWTNHLLRLWLTDPVLIAGVWHYFSFLLWGLLPITVFFSLKGIIEMRWYRPRNLYTLLFGFFVQLVTYELVRAQHGILPAVRISLLTMFWAIGILTLVWLRSYLRPFRYWGLGRLVALAAGLAALNIWLEDGMGLVGAPVAFVLSAAAIFVVFGLLFPTPFVRSFQAFVWSGHSIEESAA